MLEENEGQQSGLSQIGGVSGANAQRFNFKSFWLRERIFFFTLRLLECLTFLFPLDKIIGLTVKFLREDNLAGVKVNLYLGFWRSHQETNNSFF